MSFSPANENAALVSRIPVDERLKRWATTPRQIEIIDAVIAGGTYEAAAQALGISRGNVGDAIKRVRTLAAAQGWAPEADFTHAVPDPFIVKGHSTLRDRHGAVVLQWEKTKLDDLRRAEGIRAGLEAACEELPRLAPLARPAGSLASLANLYTFTDYHLGMMAWSREAGADWNLDIAERMLVAAFEHLVTSAPAARVAVINVQGDFLHFDGLLAVTPTHGHVLDPSARFGEIVKAAIRVLRRLCDIALMRHEEVHLIVAEGNHDIVGSLWLRNMFAALYEREPRLTVNDSEVPYYVFQWGRTMLGFHHGHMKKGETLPELFAAMFAPMWGATAYREVHVGHRHHLDVKERAGMTVVQHRTLAASDAHAARGGWMSARAASARTYHARGELVAENWVTPEMLDDGTLGLAA